MAGKSMDWFLYDNGLRHERVNSKYKFWLKLISCHWSLPILSASIRKSQKWFNDGDQNTETATGVVL